MVIAIMGDTYSKVMEQADRYKLGVCPNIYADFFFALSKLKFEEKYLYVVKFEDL